MSPPQRNTPFDHRPAQGARIEADETLVHDRDARCQLREGELFRHGLVTHAGEFFDRKDRKVMKLSSDQLS